MSAWPCRSPIFHRRRQRLPLLPRMIARHLPSARSIVRTRSSSAPQSNDRLRHRRGAARRQATRGRCQARRRPDDTIASATAASIRGTGRRTDLDRPHRAHRAPQDDGHRQRGHPDGLVRLDRRRGAEFGEPEPVASPAVGPPTPPTGASGSPSPRPSIGASWCRIASGTAGERRGKRGDKDADDTRRL